MIDVNGLQLSLKGRSILDGISFHIAAGEKAVVYGDSGSGKTSLLRCLIGLNHPQAGQVTIAGEALRPENIERIRAQICYVPQQIHTFANETGWQFVSFPFTFRANKRNAPTKSDVLTCMERFSLPEAVLDQQMTELSGGERQRLGLLRGLLLKRPIVLLDEVTSAVDKANKLRVLDVVFGDPELTVLAVAHDSEWFERSETRLYIENGRIKPDNGEA